MKKCFLTLFIFLLSIGSFAQTGSLIMYGQAGYQVTNLSPNGKWACGVIGDGSSTLVAFRWNLTTNEFTSLSEGDGETTAFGISDNGVVVGTFPDKEATVNKAPVTTAGYWKEGRWYHLETINNAYISHPDNGGQAICISRNGEYIGGAIYDKNKIYTPIIWKDGKIFKNYGNGLGGIVQTVSNDGNIAGGWSYTKKSGGTRVPTLWETGKEPVYLCKEEEGEFWRGAKNLSPNEKYMLFDWSIHNLETGENTLVPAISPDVWNFNIYSMTNDLMVVGYESAGEYGADQYAIFFKDGKTGKLEDYLKGAGVDFSKEGILLPRPGVENSYMITSCPGVSEDGKTFAIMGYDKDANQRPMIVKLGQNITTREPIALKSRQLDGINSVKLTWQAPLANQEGVKGYNVYRNGTKINSNLLTNTYYIDANLNKETYSYTVTAVYANAESVKSEQANITIAERKVEAPYNVFARQKGFNDAYIQWHSPMSNLVNKKYYSLGKDIDGFGGGTVSFESAIRYDQDEMSQYAGYKITHVCFYPMSPQEKWTINIYNGKDLVYTEDITAELNYGQENNIKLKEPLSIPNGDVYVAIKVTVPSDPESYNVMGQVFGEVTPEYSDLVRKEGEAAFYSLYSESQKNGYDFSITWAIGMILSPENVADNIDVINQYNVYVNNAKVGNTNESYYLLDNQNEGDYVYEIEAVYANGKVSDKVATALAIQNNQKVYKSISNVSVKSDGPNIVANWEAPVDNDETFITYASNEAKNGALGPKENNYGYMVKAAYSKSMLQGYSGYQVKALRFYPTANADFTFIVNKDGKEICNQYVDDYTVGQWNTIMLDEPFTIQDISEYDLMLDCFDVTPDKAPLALDGRVPFVGISDSYSLDGGSSFSSLYSATSAVGNWLIGMVLNASEGDKLPIEGYNIRIDGEKKNDVLLTNTQFAYDFGAMDNETHRINVDVMYTIIGEKKGTAVFFTLNPLGITDNQISVIRVFPNPATNYVKVEGGNVESITAYNTSGQQVAHSNAETLDVTSLGAGMYILKIRIDGMEKVAKINVIK